MNNVIFAGGCFWCTESDLRKVEGVTDVISGYTGGESDNPTYENHTGHKEAVKVVYNSEKITFKKLSQFFLDHIDPTDAGGQFFDRGSSYKTAIYYKDEREKLVAESLIKELEDSKLYDNPITVQVLPEMPFYNAEEYHQDYAKKNPSHYYAYKDGSGRTEFQAKVCTIREQKGIRWKD
jgi:peptide methionine sulfoxide reductase msrA/msrB